MTLNYDFRLKYCKEFQDINFKEKVHTELLKIVNQLIK